ncbi:DUF2157 domain-containing protein [Chitinophaga cymbidii]|uniref:DUF2157 domain-containing protein n=1 Tax=Chitinophaga cymbidii TaxID=1096750 RepID=A0A512RRH2_9BACT|nr:DUF2157 domain-containing protein [Chitinophaga cymbidii]GEP98299.1 hypothetical protein CCY01nite_45590 [Chitinophaga cymbidii]
MNISLFEKLAEEGLISAASLEKTKAASGTKLLSVHWELKVVLYLGVLLLSGGLGVLVYKNIDTISHQAVLFVIAFLCLGGFYYSFRHRQPFAWTKVDSPSVFAEYAILLACLLLVTFLTYLQVQYETFGTRYGMATFIPMVVLLFSAYYFDHLGVLSLAITNFAAWMGVTITPYRIFSRNDFSSDRLIYTGMLLGLILLAVAFVSQHKKLKRHFAFTYSNFGTHILFIALLCALIVFDSKLTWSGILAGVCAFMLWQAFRYRSFYFALVVVLYGYVELNYIVLRWLETVAVDTVVTFLYFIISGTGMVFLLLRLNKTLRRP